MKVLKFLLLIAVILSAIRMLVSCGECKHINSEWRTVTEATRESEGVKEKFCDDCHMIVKTDVIPAIGSLGLSYAPNSDVTTCTVTGMGTSSDTEIYIPSYIDGLKVTAIGEKAFSDCKDITYIKIPNTVESIGNRAFYGCTGITEITIPEGVTDIGTQIFYKASNLTTVYYNSSYGSQYNSFLNLSHIIKIVFGGSEVPAYVCYNNNSVKTVEILDSVTCISYGAFYYCSSLTSIEIPDSITSIGYSMFSGCSSLTSIEIPDSITSIGSSAFFNCSSLTGIEIPDSVTSIGDYAFSNCSSLTSIEISKSVTSIGDYAFSNCSSLTGIEIPDSVTSIGDYAFPNCSSLTSIEIPKSITSIGKKTFYGCDSLTSIKYRGTEEEWNAISKGYLWDSSTGKYTITYEYTGE